jgi:hypothetical protein
MTRAFVFLAWWTSRANRNCLITTVFGFRSGHREAAFLFSAIGAVKIEEPGVWELWRPAGLSPSFADH